MEPSGASTGFQSLRFGELERRLEKEIPDPAAESFATLYPLCFAYSQTTRYDRLLPCLDHLQRRMDTGDFMREKDNLSAAPALWRAQAWMEHGDLSRALSESQRAEPLFRSADAPPEIQLFGLAQTGLMHALSGHRNEARALAAQLEALQIDGSGTEAKSMSLARLYTALADSPKVLSTLLKEKKPVGTEDFLADLAEAALAGGERWTYRELPRQFMLHHALLETGDFPAAAAGFDQILKMKPAPENNDLLVLALVDRARIAETRGKLEEALDYYLRALKVIEQLRSPVHTEAGKAGLLCNRQEVYRHAVALLVSMGDAEGAFQTVERAKARLLVDVLATQEAFLHPAESATPVSATLAQLIRAERQAALQDAAPNGAERLEPVRKLHEDLKHSDPHLASLLAVQVLTAADVQSRLNPQETLLEYFHQGEHLFVFVLDQDMLHMQRLDGKGLDAEVRTFLAALNSPKSTNYLELARGLFHRLIAPVVAHLKKPLVTLVAHGLLHDLPFNALYSGERHFIESYNLRLLPSASMLAYLRAPVPGPFFGALVVGNPGGDLKFAGQEVQTIGKLAQTAEVLAGLQATETRFKEAAARFPHLHLATRGRFLSDAPLHSGLQLAGDETNDGVLTISEVYPLGLKARLVTLSACEMDPGVSGSGQEVVSLMHGFFYAGAQSLVASWWSVNDRATADLMEAFYLNLDKAPVSLALRQAQLAVRSQYPHPYYWAGFQLTGSFQ